MVYPYTKIRGGGGVLVMLKEGGAQTVLESFQHRCLKS